MVADSTGSSTPRMPAASTRWRLRISATRLERLGLVRTRTAQRGDGAAVSPASRVRTLQEASSGGPPMTKQSQPKRVPEQASAPTEPEDSGYYELVPDVFQEHEAGLPTDHQAMTHPPVQPAKPTA